MNKKLTELMEDIQGDLMEETKKQEYIHHNGVCAPAFLLQTLDQNFHDCLNRPYTRYRMAPQHCYDKHGAY